MKGSYRKPSRRLTFEDAVEVWPRIWRGEFLNRIASDLDVNPGRIAEIKKGYRFEGSREEASRRQAH
jgi:hypothetical protein